MPSVDLADTIIEAAGASIAHSSFETASRELPWDGYGGLIRICDDDSLREQGVVRAVARQPRELLQGRGHAAGPDRPSGRRNASGVAASQRDSPPAPRPQPTATEPSTRLPVAAAAAARTAHAASLSAAALNGPPETMVVVGGTAPPWGAATLAGHLLPSPPLAPPPPPLLPTPASQAPPCATQGGAGAGEPGSAAISMSSTGRAAPRRIPSWVQEYVLSSADSGGDEGGISGSGPASSRGPMAAGVVTMDVGAPPAAGVTTREGKFMGPPPPPPLQPSNQTLAPQQRQVQPQLQQPQLRQQLQQLQHLQQVHQQLRRQQQQIGRRSPEPAGGEPDLSWLAQLPTPPTNKPIVRK